MNINEMIEELRFDSELDMEINDLAPQIADMLEELKQYQELGTVEELKSVKEFRDTHKSNPSFIGKRFIDNQTGNIIEVIGEPTGYWQDCACRCTVTGKEFLRPKTYVLANEVTNKDTKISEESNQNQDKNSREDELELQV